MKSSGVSALCWNLHQTGLSQSLSHAPAPAPAGFYIWLLRFLEIVCQSNLYFSLAAVVRGCEVELLLLAVCREMENQPSLLVL